MRRTSYSCEWTNLLLFANLHLLIISANLFRTNDDSQKALDLARARRHSTVVRAIENHICLFSGWLRELHGPSFLEALARKWIARKVWAVVLPCDSLNSSKPLKFVVALYPDLQVARPLAVIELWKVRIEEPQFNQPDTALTMVDKSEKRVRKFFSAHDGDKLQLQSFYNACRGMRQINNHVQATPVSSFISNPPQPHTYSLAASTGPQISFQEDEQLAIALSASIQSIITEGVLLPDVQPATSRTSNTSNWGSRPHAPHNGWGIPDGVLPSETRTQGTYNGWDLPEAAQPEVRPSNIIPLSPLSVPSAPPIVDEAFYGDPIHYPSIDSTLVDRILPCMETKPEGSGAEKSSGLKTESGSSGVKEGSSDSRSCVICLDAPVEGACIPCGHMAGCVLCLNEIKAKEWGCPVCRTKIEQVVKLYVV